MWRKRRGLEPERGHRGIEQEAQQKLDTLRERAALYPKGENPKGGRDLGAAARCAQRLLAVAN
jgi:hypothetical protein